MESDLCTIASAIFSPSGALLTSCWPVKHLLTVQPVAQVSYLYWNLFVLYPFTSPFLPLRSGQSLLLLEYLWLFLTSPTTLGELIPLHIGFLLSHWNFLQHSFLVSLIFVFLSHLAKCLPHKRCLLNIYWIHGRNGSIFECGIIWITITVVIVAK